MNAQLCGQGIAAADAVESFGWQRFGTGQVGDSVRLTLSYRAGHAGPATLVIKLPSPDPTSRATAASFQLYRKEVGFYQELARHLEVRVPTPIGTAISAQGDEFLILFEDLGPARGGNQLAGCTLEDARAAIVEAAAFHAPSRGNSDLLSAQWLQPRADLGAQLMALYPQAQAVFRERYSDLLAPELMEICEGLANHAELWFARQPEAPCLVHGDFRLDNMLFDIKGGAEPIAVLDWQTVAIGDGPTDIGYFLGCGVGSALRRPHEEELLALYAEAMALRNVRLAPRDLMDQYRIGALHGVSTAVFSSANVVRTDRGDENFLSMARGACELALDHDSLGLLKHKARNP
ncbi:phosphotransferase [Novosphingobium sp.]|uniref:phosphotransferase family protein n=1 Tax=Novosphingobium sp. TaxID=1874826 RepID=UPI0025EC83BB|nr:phosphotransferase [Novosphingobium sp.]